MIGEALAILSALMQAISTVLSAKALKNVDPIWSNVIKSETIDEVRFKRHRFKHRYAFPLNI